MSRSAFLTTPAALSIVVAYYDDIHTATSVLRTIEQPATTVDLLDIGVLRMASSGWRLEVVATAPRDNWGVLRDIFSPEVLALRSVGADATAAGAYFRDLGFDSNLLKEIGENMPPGGAALVAVVEEKWLAAFSVTVGTHHQIGRFGKRPEVPLGAD